MGLVLSQFPLNGVLAQTKNRDSLPASLGLTAEVLFLPTLAAAGGATPVWPLPVSPLLGKHLTPSLLPQLRFRNPSFFPKFLISAAFVRMPVWYLILLTEFYLHF